MNTNIADISVGPGDTISLPRTKSWPKSVHRFTKESLNAIKVALASGRPLLIRGEPGTGKSQLARAAAHILKRNFIYEVVHARMECQDLQWHYDAVGRLGDAQLLGTGYAKEKQKNSSEQGKNESIDIVNFLNERKYLSPKALWWAFDYSSAMEQYDKYCHRKLHSPPDSPEFEGKVWDYREGSVLLIDEIDKADIDLPNGLLETLGNGSFSVPYLDKSVGHNPKVKPPLVIITTNEERALPSAFIRRCMVLRLSLPKEKEPLKTALKDVGRVHSKCSEDVLEKVAEQLAIDRQAAKEAGLAVPGQAEYLDILRVLEKIGTNEMHQCELLDEISHFALKKQLEES